MILFSNCYDKAKYPALMEYPVLMANETCTDVYDDVVESAFGWWCESNSVCDTIRKRLRYVMLDIGYLDIGG